MARKIDRLYDDEPAPQPPDPLADFGRLILPSSRQTPATDPQTEPRLPLSEPPAEFNSLPAADDPKLRRNKRGK